MNHSTEEQTPTNRIEKKIELMAPVSRVWRALTDHREFSAWFEMTIEHPFVRGEESVAIVTYPRYKDLRMSLFVVAIEPERYFAYKWHPFAVDPAIDYSKERPTLVEFYLEPTLDGSSLTVIDSGFDNLPENRRAIAFRSNEGGWRQQFKNIEAYLAKQA